MYQNIYKIERKTKMIAYHRKVGFPSSLNISKKLFNLVYTKHATDKLNNRYKKPLQLIPRILRITKNNLVEAYTKDGIKLSKALVRLPYIDRKDICLVVKPLPKKNEYKVITVWLNPSHDDRPNLDLSKFKKPKNELQRVSK